MPSSSTGSSASKHTSPDPSRQVLVKTDKLMIVRDRHGVFGKVAPSKAAPRYLTTLIKNSHHVLEDVSIEDSFDSSCSRSYEELLDWKKRVQDEERLSKIYKLRKTFSLRFDNRAWLHPNGTTNFDYKAIPEVGKEKLEGFKNRVRQENYKYLGNHPEIQAIISLAIKKLLGILPHDPVKFLTDFFTSHMNRKTEFEEAVEAELKRISKYHVNKMQAAGRVNIKPSTAVRSELSGESWMPEQDANHLKKLNIGALAQDFSFDASSMKARKKKGRNTEQGEKLKLKKKKKKQCGPTKYCGCKDWKLKKNQQSEKTNELVATAEEEEDLQTITFSTLGNVKDIGTSAEEEDEEMILFGDGEFLGAVKKTSESLENLTTAEAEEIAGLLVTEVLAGAAGSK